MRYTHPFNGPLSGTTQVSRYQKVKPIWILLEQETVSGSGIIWAICKSATRSRQITTPAPHHSVFTGRMPFMPPNQQRQSTEGMNGHNIPVFGFLLQYNAFQFFNTLDCQFPDNDVSWSVCNITLASLTPTQHNTVQVSVTYVPCTPVWQRQLCAEKSIMYLSCLQCLDAVGWAAGKASGL